MSLGHNLYSIRIKNGLTQERLAELCGLTVNFVSRIERGKATRVSVFTVQKIAKALGVSIDTLMDDKKIESLKELRPNQLQLNQVLDGRL